MTHNSEVFWAILSADIQPNAAEPFGQGRGSDLKQPKRLIFTCWGQRCREIVPRTEEAGSREGVLDFKHSPKPRDWGNKSLCHIQIIIMTNNDNSNNNSYNKDNSLFMSNHFTHMFVRWCLFSPAGAVHRQGVCIRVESQLQLGLVAYVSLPAQVHQRNTHGKSPSIRRQGGLQRAAEIGCKMMLMSGVSVKGSPWKMTSCNMLISAGIESKDPKTAGQVQDLPCGLRARHLHLFW